MKVIIKKYLYKNKELFFFFGLVAIYLVWSFGNFFNTVGSGLDPSWILALNWVKNTGAQWGKDFIFTYGPLYHFAGYAVPDFYSPKTYLLIQIGINLFYSVIKVGVVFLFYHRTNSSYKIFSAILSGTVMLLCVFSPLELITFIIIMLLCDSFHKLIENGITINKRPVINNILASLLLVITQYAKFSFFNIAAVLLVLLSILYIFFRKYKIAVIFTGSYIIFSILLWVVSGQNIKNLFGYIYTGLQLSSGYTPAMKIHFTDFTIFNIFVFAFITIGVFVIMLIYLFLKKEKHIFFLYFLISPQLFLLFKESFVRAAGHAYSYISNIPLIALYLLFVSVLFPVSKQQNKLFGINMSHCVIIMAMVVIFISMSNVNVRLLPNNYVWQIISNDIHYNNNVEATKQHIRNQYGNYNELAKYINTNEKTDIFPWDISLLYSYDLNWQPRPVIQSYANYTTALDKLTAKHFLTEKAPDKLIFTPMTIDGRYALFDEPETFRTVLLNYSSVVNNSSYLILGKNKQINPVSMEEIYIVTARTGELIEVPFCDDAYVFMKVDWDYNLFGKFANFFFKTSFAYIELYLTDGSNRVYRFVHKTAGNGLFVSKYVSNTQELMQVFDKDFTPDITSVRILGRSLFYKRDVKVNFYKIKDNRPYSDMRPVMVPKANIPIPQDITGILVNDVLSMDKTDEILTLHCGTYDPYICLLLQEPIDNPSNSVLEIKYSNSTAGTIQFFYDFGNGYNEIDSVPIRLDSSEKSTLRVPVVNWQTGTKLVSIRIDPPNGTKFELESIWLYGSK
jgi:hypothetical protein